MTQSYKQQHTASSRVRVPLCPLAGFVLGFPEFKSSATLVNQFAAPKKDEKANPF